MDPGWLVLLSLLLGTAIGAAWVHLLSVAAQRGRSAFALSSAPVPDGVLTVVDALESACIVVDGSEQVVNASQAATVLDLVAGRELREPQIRELIRQVWRTGEPVTSDIVHKRGRIGLGQTVHLHVRVAMLGTRFVLVVAEDRSEEVRLTGVRRDFVANVSHELKTPIGAVAVLADAIEVAADDPDRVRGFAARLQVESERLGRMTKELIDLSRIQADDPLATPARVRVSEVVDAAVDRTRVAAEAKRVRLAVKVLDDASVLGDASMLTTAVQNLIANAVQHSEDDAHVGVGVRLANDVVEVAVSDKGSGIPLEEQERVFERFYRVDPARSRVTGGTGLGLSIVRHIATSHAGEVTLWSKPGHGSTFTLRLPVAPAAGRKEIA